MFLEQIPSGENHFGWIEVICGSMFSGKTEELIRRIRRANFAKQKVEIYKPKIDNRYHDTSVVSHNKDEVKAISINSASDILTMHKGARIVAIDEAQFFGEDLLEVCNKLANKKVRVIVAGLDMDYTGKPFGPMPEILAVAEYVTKVHAICLSCGQLAQYSNRVSTQTEQVVLGETDSYEALCRSCYNKIKRD